MTKRILIHGGFPKTGSTSIQRFCMARHGALSAAGVLFPCDPAQAGLDPRALPPGGPHEDVVPHLRHRALPWPRTAARGGRRIDWGAVLRDFRDDPRHHTLVISAEMISMAGPRLDTARLAGWRDWADLRFLTYLRAAPAWLESYYRQLILGRSRFDGTPAEMDAVARYLRGGYAALLAPFAVTGEVILRDFDALARDDRLLADFCAVLDLPHLAGTAQAMPRANTRVHSRAEILIARALKQQRLPRPQIMEVRRAINRGLPPEARQSEPVLPAPVMAAIADRWERDRAWLHRVHRLDPAAADPARIAAAPPDLRLRGEVAADLARRFDRLEPPLRARALRALQCAEHGDLSRLQRAWARARGRLNRHPDARP